jgi:hypothetical protein
MAEIEKLIQNLKSASANVRYEACEELRVSQSIPDEAIQALQVALTDPNPDVVDAATRALNAHQQDFTSPLPEEIPIQMKKDTIIVIALLLLILGGCTGMIAISLVNPGPGMDEILHTIMEQVVDPPWIGFALISTVLLISSLALFGRAKKK